MGFFLRAQERIRNSRGKRAVSVQAIEVLLNIYCFCFRSGHHHIVLIMLFPAVASMQNSDMPAMAFSPIRRSVTNVKTRDDLSVNGKNVSNLICT